MFVSTARRKCVLATHISGLFQKMCVAAPKDCVAWSHRANVSFIVFDVGERFEFVAVNPKMHSGQVLARKRFATFAFIN